jgi:transposase
VGARSWRSGCGAEHGTGAGVDDAVEWRRASTTAGVNVAVVTSTLGSPPASWWLNAPRVNCPEYGVTVAEVFWARHDSAFSRAFEDLVVFDAIVSSKLAVARRYGISWRAVNNMCVRVATEALGRVDLSEGLVALTIDEVKYKKGHKYLTVVCDHMTGKVIWAAKGPPRRSSVPSCPPLGAERAGELQLVTCDGAAWIRPVVAERAPEAIVCLDTFRLIGWATEALDEVRREGWNHRRRTGGAQAAKEFKGLRWMRLGNWENLSPKQKGTIGDLEEVNKRIFRAWRQIGRTSRHHVHALGWGTVGHPCVVGLRQPVPSGPFVKLARSIRHYRASIEATIEWELTNGISYSNNATPLPGSALQHVASMIPELHHDDHAQPGRHRLSAARRNRVMTHERSTRPEKR